MTESFCGTTEYLAPEIIKDKQYGFSVDWYSLGLVMFEMCAGFNPFKTGRETTFADQVDLIIHIKFEMPTHFSSNCADLCTKLLEKDVSILFFLINSLRSELVAVRRALKKLKIIPGLVE